MTIPTTIVGLGCVALGLLLTFVFPIQASTTKATGQLSSGFLPKCAPLCRVLLSFEPAFAGWGPPVRVCLGDAYRIPFTR